MRWPLIALLISAALQFLSFARWPGNPVRDVTYSIFAAHNLVAQGQLKAINVMSDYGGDLTQFARLHWLIQFPPGHSLLYAAAMGAGLSAGAATKLLALAGIAIGGFGWVTLARLLGASRNCIVAIGAAYPWLPYVGAAYLFYTNEHIALAVTPWLCFAVLRIEPLDDSPVDARKKTTGARRRGLWLAALLALIAVAFKYSMVPVVAAVPFYLLLQDRAKIKTYRPGWAAALLGFMALPGLLFLLVDHAYRPRVVLAPEGLPFSWPGLVQNLVNNSIAGILGWDNVFPQSMYLLQAVHVQPSGRLIMLASLGFLAIWISIFWRWPLRGRQKSFAIFLGLMTMALWAMLLASTFLSHLQWDFSSEGRVYKPIMLMWLFCCILFLDRMRPAGMLRLLGFCALALPLMLTAFGYAAIGLLETPYARMPRSGLAWTATQEESHAKFLAELASARKPDLLISDEPWAMTELDVPSLYGQLAVQYGGRFWSGAPLQVWTITGRAETKDLLAHVEGASIEHAVTPPGYPYDVNVLTFDGSSQR